MLEEDRSLDVRFLGVYHEDNAKELTLSIEALAGKALDGFWDRSEKAGPKCRSATTFHEELPNLECLTIVEGAL